eukprot:3623767-Alexandrium_andersonii.AAC.1
MSASLVGSEMCIRDSYGATVSDPSVFREGQGLVSLGGKRQQNKASDIHLGWRWCSWRWRRGHRCCLRR